MVVLSVPTMHCDKCRVSIERKLKQIDGTRYVRVDLDDRSVEVGGPVEPPVLIDALEAIGFASSVR